MRRFGSIAYWVLTFFALAGLSRGAEESNVEMVIAAAVVYLIGRDIHERTRG